MLEYTIYLIVCNTPNHLYVGYTSNFAKRIHNHRLGDAAKFTAKYGVKEVVKLGVVNNIKAAKKMEHDVTKSLMKYSELRVCGAGWSSSL